MNALTAGAALALLVAGYPLYELVTSGGLDATSALLRGGVVVVGCAAGVTVIARIALGYEAQAAADRRRKLSALFSTMEGAVAEGTLTEEIARAGDGASPAPRPSSPSSSPPSTPPAAPAPPKRP